MQALPDGVYLSGKNMAKSKKAILMDGLFFIWCLAVPYSRMGRPHTTIGATAFHF